MARFLISLTFILFFVFPAFAGDYQWISSFGHFGKNPGELNGPFDVAVDAAGDLYITDANNHRVQKWSSEGKPLLIWGKEGKGPGEFQKPTGIAIAPEGSVYVSDYFLDRVQKFTPDGKFLLKWGKNGKKDGELDSPSGVAVDSRGNVYVVDTYNHRVQKFSSDGRFILKWGEREKVNNVRSVLNFLWDEELEGRFYYPAKIAVSPNDEIYVSDSYNNRVQVFTSGGGFIRKWGGLGIWGGRFRVASGIVFDPAGNVLVADFYNHRVQKFNSAGRYLDQFGSRGDKEGQFNGPVGLAVDTKGYVYVADFHHFLIQKFQNAKVENQSYGKYLLNQNNSYNATGKNQKMGNLVFTRRKHTGMISFIHVKWIKQNKGVIKGSNLRLYYTCNRLRIFSYLQPISTPFSISFFILSMALLTVV